MPKPAITDGTTNFFNVFYHGKGVGQRVGTFLPFTDNGTVSQSCLFDDGSSSYLSRTHSASNKKTFTFSAWIKRCATGAYQRIFNASDAGDNEHFIFRDSDVLHFYSGDASADVKTTRTFNDTSKFYHIVLRVDTTQSTASDRVRIYVDGEEITALATATYPSQDADTAFNGNVAHDIGRSNSSSQYFDGYMAEVNFADGQSYGPDTFGLTDTSTGKWIPKSLGSITYGTNGFRLTFANSAGQTIGDDTSGNGNDFTVSGIATDHVKDDSPTQNFTNMGGDDTGSFTKAEGNLNITSPGSGQYEQVVGQPDFGVATGKWYWEVRVYNKGKTQLGWKSDDHVGGSAAADTSTSPHTGSGAIGIGYNVGSSGGFADGEWTDDYSNALSEFSTFSAASGGDIVMFALDLDNSKGYVGLNGTWFNSANPANGTGSIGLSTPATGRNKFYPMMLRLDSAGQNNFNFGQNRTFSAAFDKSAVANTASSGPGFFKYTPPTDFLAICEDNLPDVTKYKPDLAWFKAIGATNNHLLIDSSRGGNKQLQPNLVNAELTQEDMIQKFLPGGYAVEDFVNLNADNVEYISWNWVVNGGTTSANTDGSGATLASTIQANQTAGCSIVQYVGNNTAGAKIAHGLSQKPKTIWIKDRDGGSYEWMVYWEGVDNSVSEQYYLQLSADDAGADLNTIFNDTAPTASVFTIGNNASVNANTNKYVAYCFHSVEGFSRIDRYLGNGNAAGPYVITGFEPQFLLLKCSDAAGAWIIYDNARSKFNPRDKIIYANVSDAEVTHASNYDIDFLSNGFKIRNSTSAINHSGRFFQFMAFAKNPFIGDGTNPGTAR